MKTRTTKQEDGGKKYSTNLGDIRKGASVSPKINMAQARSISKDASKKK